MYTKKYRNNLIILGKTGIPYGIHGWLRLYSFTEELENIFLYNPWYINNNYSYRFVEVEKWRYYGKKIFLIKLTGINDRNKAISLNNYNIVINSSSLINIGNINQYYWKDILYCTVFTVYGYFIGRIVSMIRTNVNDVMYIKNFTDIFNKKERFIPFINSNIICNVCIKNKIILVNWEPDF